MYVCIVFSPPMSLTQLFRHTAPLFRHLPSPFQQPAKCAGGIAAVIARGYATAGKQQLYGGETLQQIRHRIFGDHIGNGLSSGRKVLRRKLVGDKIAAYYGDLQELQKADPLLVDLHAEAKKVKLDKLKRRGKAPPKKGEGKRGKKR